jgi:anti-anti-sigma factor
MAELDRGDIAEVKIDTSSDATGTPTVAVSGELDVSNVDSLKATIAAVTSNRPERLVFDLSALEFMDSAGIALLLYAAELVGVVEVTDPSPAVRRVIELTGMTKILSLKP